MIQAKDLTVKDLAKELDIHPDTVKRLLRSGVLSGYKADLKQWRVTRVALDKFKASGGAHKPGRPRQKLEENQ
jgi:excisionase family DNA binding protein